ncbi:MAG: hypothetical protein JWM65_311 [Sphingomonas bacterium]|nr:hypothetical protein [Sphingomonas bacterium]
MLREAVANLAAPPTLQVAYLDRIFVQCTGGGSAAAYGNEELLLELDDSFTCTNHMMECGEITANEVASVGRLNDYINAIWQAEDEIFLERESLFHDPRWEGIRTIATEALADLPDEIRESDYMRELARERNGS